VYYRPFQHGLLPNDCTKVPLLISFQILHGSNWSAVSSRC